MTRKLLMSAAATVLALGLGGCGHQDSGNNADEANLMGDVKSSGENEMDPAGSPSNATGPDTFANSATMNKVDADTATNMAAANAQ